MGWLLLSAPAIAFAARAGGERKMAKETKYPMSAQEAQVKACVARDWFAAYDTTNCVGNIDFSVAEPSSGAIMTQWLLWAEAKKGASHDIDESFVQLILTVGRARTFDRHLPPRHLGAFDAARIAFLPYHAIQDVFALNDFNWNVAPNNHETREFALLKKRVSGILASEKLSFDYLADAAELKRFILRNFAQHAKAGVAKIPITKNNFTHIYNRWRASVKPSIDFDDWEAAKRNGIIDADFFLADILSRENSTLTNRLNILLRNDHYRQAAGTNALGLSLFSDIGFKDGQKAHAAFWRLYERPPKEEYWDYIVNRRDLLVPQDVREVKGAFFTPARWVELSQEYLARELGENWQDEYYVWDCCAGTGNLLAGLVNRKNIWASTLERQDVDAMLQRIEFMNGARCGDAVSASRDGGDAVATTSGANLFPSHVFQFDFLNDPFTKLPQGLRDILNDPEKRRRLVIYINPPYKEATSARQKTGTGENVAGLTKGTPRYERYLPRIGTAARELFALFLMRIHEEIPGCVVGQFSTLKHLQSPNFAAFRRAFRARLCRSFLVPADTFDNVKGKFPIGFFVWRLGDEGTKVTEGTKATEGTKTTKGTKETAGGDAVPGCSSLSIRTAPFTSAVADVYDRKGERIGTKAIHSYDGDRFVIEWLRQFYDKKGERIGYLRMIGTDVQNSAGVFIASDLSPNDFKKHTYTVITRRNFVEMCIYMAIRHVVEATWLNDRDQFLWPKDSWKDDFEFQYDCLVWALFDNVVKSADGVNHWVPFSEEAAGTRDEIASHFMIDVLCGDGVPAVAAVARDRDRDGGGRAGARPSPQQGELELGGVEGTKGTQGTKATGGESLKSLSSLESLSPEARAVLDAALPIYRRYHAQPNSNPNASFYDIRQHFQSVNGRGVINATSTDEEYNVLLAALRAAQRRLAAKIADGVYRHGFLK